MKVKTLKSKCQKHIYNFENKKKLKLLLTFFATLLYEIVDFLWNNISFKELFSDAVDELFPLSVSQHYWVGGGVRYKQRDGEGGEIYETRTGTCFHEKTDILLKQII